VRFNLMRDLEGGAQEIIGVYHSHPDHGAEPSAHDLSMACEPDLVWLITAVRKGGAEVTTAHVLSDVGGRFHQVELNRFDVEKDTP
jgi:proteasome lid subunit RPN8/RPN11